jgi:hypothetical protein
MPNNSTPHGAPAELRKAGISNIKGWASLATKVSRLIQSALF